jgi:acetyl/propionyl-CoA carboxylase alpha subunit/acetyl-CoA carboxylase carboxyltransferase component
MMQKRLLIANRGEIAIRIARAAADLGITTVAIYSEDDAGSSHTRFASDARPLRGRGPSAYLDAEQILMLAREIGCDTIHPGYGFLSENADFARRCAALDLRFVGPSPEHLELFGDKPKARALALRCDVPVLPGTFGPTSLPEAERFLASLGPQGAIMLKAVAGGGGRGIRVVHQGEDLTSAYERSRSEARRASGRDELYVEQFIACVRHIEVQLIGDGRNVTHLWERECTIQRQRQKLIEVAPSPVLSTIVREQILEAALRLARTIRYENLGTFEFLVSTEPGAEPSFVFIEVNPRLQVEHTVTEAVTGVDLVETQLRIAAGASLEELGLHQTQVPPPRGYAIELRINLEVLNNDGSVNPTSGTLQIFEPPAGPGVRVDTFAYAGYSTNPSFDSLLAKLIVYAPTSYPAALRRAKRALSEFRLEGVRTNIPVLAALLARPEFADYRVFTTFVEQHAAALVEPAAHAVFTPTSATHHRPRNPDRDDPLALFRAAGEPSVAPSVSPRTPIAPQERENLVPVCAPMQATVVALEVCEGDCVHTGQQIAVLEAMKMEHIIASQVAGVVRGIGVAPGDTVFDGHPLVFIEPVDVPQTDLRTLEAIDLDQIRSDLAETLERHAITQDERRPDAVARRRKTGQRTARENIADLCDQGSFIEYGGLLVAAQRHRRSPEELIQMSPADGLVTGIGSINGDRFDETRSRCMVMAYDFTVLAGTQGVAGHKKKDRLLAIAQQWRLPLVLFAEGGGGRPGDDWVGAGLDVLTFTKFAALSGLVPLIGIVSGRCFAGNAALLGCCDVIIATANTNIGMGGPAMIEGGGLGVFRPEEVGPMSVQVPNGVVDLAVLDEAEAVRLAKQYLSYFQGAVEHFSCADQRLLRRLIPENRLRVYDIRTVIATLADSGSVLELRPQFGIGMITALVRIEGRPMGLIANNPMHLGGAIDAEAADKAARFLQLCDGFDLPILSLCDTPGFMVGPEVEKSAQVRRVCRMFVAGASVTVPLFCVVLRKGYGLGSQAMIAGSFHASVFTVSWPTGEFGGMGLEGAVKLAYRKELTAVTDPKQRKALFEKMVAQSYQDGKALRIAGLLEIDDVIDPMETRRWIMRGLRSLPPIPVRTGKKRPCIDTR